MNNREYDLIWESYSRQTAFEQAVQELCYHNQIIEEGWAGDALSKIKQVASTVADQVSKYNPADLLRQMHISMGTAKDNILNSNPKASKLASVIANPTTARAGVMALSLLGALAGMDANAANEILDSLPADPTQLDNALEQQLDAIQQAKGNVQAGMDQTQGTLYNPDTLENTPEGQKVVQGMEDREGADQYTTYQGDDNENLNSTLDALVQNDPSLQEFADNIKMGYRFEKALEFGKIFGNILSASDQLTSAPLELLDGTTVEGAQEERFTSYIKSAIEDKNGNEIVLFEQESTSTYVDIDNSTGNQAETGVRWHHEKSSGLEVDISTMVGGSIDQFPEEVQDKIWQAYWNDPNMTLDPDKMDSIGEEPQQQAAPAPNPNMQQTAPQQQFNGPSGDIANTTGAVQTATQQRLAENKYKNTSELIWEAYANSQQPQQPQQTGSNAAQQATARIKQNEQAFVNQHIPALKNQIGFAIQKLIQSGQQIPQKMTLQELIATYKGVAGQTSQQPQVQQTPGVA